MSGAPLLIGQHTVQFITQFVSLVVYKVDIYQSLVYQFVEIFHR